MRSLPRWTSRRQPADGIPPHAIPAPRRREPSAPLYGLADRGDDTISYRDLPPENPHLLRARPSNPAGRVNVQNLGLCAVDLTALARTTARPPCQILAVSRDETAARAAFEFEVTVGQNLAMLADQEHPAVTR